jgi:hypothetical protein
LAAQSLAVDMRLHTLFDESRHEGKNEMVYTASTSESAVASDSDMSMSKGEDSDNDQNEVENLYLEPEDDAMEEDNYTDGQDDRTPPLEDNSDLDAEDNTNYIFEDDNEINMKAYVDLNSDTDDPKKTEQGGVLHLVHGWIQRANPDRVCTLNVFFFCCAHSFRVYSYLGIYLPAAPRLLLRDPITLLPNLLRVRLVSRSRPSSPNGMKSIRKLSKPGFGFRMIQDPSWVVRLYTSCKAGFTETDTMLDPLYLFLSANLPGVKCCFRSLDSSYSGYYPLSMHFTH